MASVFKGTQVDLDRAVAIKFIKLPYATDDKFRARFLREAQLAAAVRHPNCITIFDYGRHDGRPYLVMELLAGESLADRLERDAPSPRESIDIALEILAGIGAAHAAGIVHRDLKPDNVFLAEGEPPLVKVLDFGIARAADANLTKITQTGAFIGTPAYASPEQCNGQTVDHRSDLYSFGCLLFELLAGHTPFREPSAVSLLVAHVGKPAPLLALPDHPDLEAPLARLTSRLLEKSPSARPSSAGEVAGELRAALTPTSALPAERPAAPAHRSADEPNDPRVSNRMLAVAAAGLGLLVAFATLGGLALLPSGTASRITELHLSEDIPARRAALSLRDRNDQLVAQFEVEGRLPPTPVARLPPRGPQIDWVGFATAANDKSLGTLTLIDARGQPAVAWQSHDKFFYPSPEQAPFSQPSGYGFTGVALVPGPEGPTTLAIASARRWAASWLVAFDAQGSQLGRRYHPGRLEFILPLEGGRIALAGVSNRLCPGAGATPCGHAGVIWIVRKPAPDAVGEFGPGCGGTQIDDHDVGFLWRNPDLRPHRMAPASAHVGGFEVTVTRQGEPFGPNDCRHFLRFGDNGELLSNGNTGCAEKLELELADPASYAGICKAWYAPRQ